jgi:hypothetical protein
MRVEETLCPILNKLNVKENKVQRKLRASTRLSISPKNVANKGKTIKINYKWFWRQP